MSDDKPVAVSYKYEDGTVVTLTVAKEARPDPPFPRGILAGDILISVEGGGFPPQVEGRIDIVALEGLGEYEFAHAASKFLGGNV